MIVVKLEKRLATTARYVVEPIFSEAHICHCNKAVFLKRETASIERGTGKVSSKRLLFCL